MDELNYDNEGDAGEVSQPILIEEILDAQIFDGFSPKVLEKQNHANSRYISIDDGL